MVNLGEYTTLNAQTNITGPVNYNWQPEFGLSCYNCESPVFTGNYTTTYNLRVSDTSGCFKNTAAKVEVIPDYTLFIPNVFSPNGDGQNDFWQLFGNMSAIKQLDVKVFNRWGEKVFESNDLYFQWDGSYKSQKQQPGVFVYYLDVVWVDNNSMKSYKGSITLLK
jgi:gliding motility-associated-like protein